MNPSMTRQKTPAHQLRDAASSGNLAELQRLVQEGVPVNDRSSFNNTALLYAANHGKRECVRFLIDNGADVNIANNSGYTPLISAATIGDYESVKMLLEAEAEVWHTLKEEDGSLRRTQQTALTLAERHKHYRVVELLKIEERRRRRRHRRVSLSQNQSSIIRPGNTFDFKGGNVAGSNNVLVLGKTAAVTDMVTITVTYELDKFRRNTKYEVVK